MLSLSKHRVGFFSNLLNVPRASRASLVIQNASSETRNALTILHAR